jgi:ribosome maturation factor RimP
VTSKTVESTAERASGRPAGIVRVEAAVTELVQPILASTGLVLDRLEFVRGGGRPVLRVFIDREGGVSVDDCAEVSRQLSALLDDDEVVRGGFVLEVSSPGLTRPLRGEEDFRRFAGRLAVLHGRSPLHGKRRDVTGRLAGVEDGCVLVDEQRSGERLRVPLEQVAKARLELEL